jgi:hypothetical protein
MSGVSARKAGTTTIRGPALRFLALVPQHVAQQLPLLQHWLAPQQEALHTHFLPQPHTLSQRQVSLSPQQHLLRALSRGELHEHPCF